MNEINKKNINSEIEILKNIINKKDKLCKTIKTQLEENGYTYAVLGTGNYCSIRSKEIKVMELKGVKYLKGEYLVVGMYSTSAKGKSVYYRGYIKKIID